MIMKNSEMFGKIKCRSRCITVSQSIVALCNIGMTAECFYRDETVSLG